MPAGLSDFDCGRQACQPATNYDNFRCCCHKPFLTTKETKEHQESSSRFVRFLRCTLHHAVHLRPAAEPARATLTSLCCFVSFMVNPNVRSVPHLLVLVRAI